MIYGIIEKKSLIMYGYFKATYNKAKTFFPKRLKIK